MKDPRPINTLLKLMLENTHLFSYGLRGWAQNLLYANVINQEEYLILNDYILSNQPIQPTPFVTFWWPRSYLLPREEWLNEHIKLTESIDDRSINIRKLKRIILCNWLFKLEIIAVIIYIILLINMVMLKTCESVIILAHTGIIAMFVTLIHQLVIMYLVGIRFAKRSSSKEKQEI